MSSLRFYFKDNPMMVEITRFRRRFLGGSSLNSVIFAMCALIYVGLVALVWNYRESANPIILIFLQTLIFTLLGPAMLHGAIAGERERRSWDFLLVAPVTHGQIVVGKFMGAAAAILTCAVAFLLPIGIGAVSYGSYHYSAFGSQPQETVGLGLIIQAEMLSVSWGFLVCAATLFFSARCRRPFIALGAILGLMIGGLIIWPILISAAGFSREIDFLVFFHPFWALARLEMGRSRMSDPYGLAFGLPQILSYIVLSIVFLVWTEKTLRFADSEVKFLPQQKNA